MIHNQHSPCLLFLLEGWRGVSTREWVMGALASRYKELACIFLHLHPPLGDVDEPEAVPAVHGVAGVLGVQVPGDPGAIAIGQEPPAIVGPVQGGIWREGERLEISREE